MIRIPSVLVLGAGASQPFGLPTAPGLRDGICKMLSDSGSFESKTVSAAVRENTQLVPIFRDGLDDARPPSVDAWLEKKENQDFLSIGKAAIATCLLNHENKSKLKLRNSNWYDILWYNLIDGANSLETFGENKLRVVTFNYDRSLEEALFTRLKNTYYGKKDTEYAEKLRSTIPIVHVYGKLGPLLWQPCKSNSCAIPYDIGQFLDEQSEKEDFNDFDIAYRWRVAVGYAMKKIDIVLQGTKIPADTEPFKEARKYIESAEALYFLGFGYHRENMERLGIESLRKPIKLMGTIHGLKSPQLNYVEDLSLRDLYKRTDNLVDAKVYEFLTSVDFNVL